MKITRIPALRIEAPLHGAICKWPCGTTVSGSDSTKVAAETDIREA